MKQKISDQELVEALKKRKPGRLPEDLFYQFCRLWTTPHVDILCFFEERGKIFVYLPDRVRDWHYQKIVHIPGTVILPDDRGLKMVIARLRREELKGLRAKHIFFSHVLLQKNKRGPEIGIEMGMEVASPRKRDGFYRADRLPNNLVPFHRPVVRNIIRSYKKNSVLSPKDVVKEWFFED